MILASLLDLGLDEAALLEIIGRFKPRWNFSLSIEKTTGKRVRREPDAGLTIVDEEAHSSHITADDEAEELIIPAVSHHSGDEARHNHDSQGGHSRGATFAEIQNVIRSAKKPEEAERKALETFELLAKRKPRFTSKVYATSFHEVGAVEFHNRRLRGLRRYFSS
jgi:uncharacterized protein (DUF111 family)